MPEWLVLILLVVFVIHFVVFIRVALKKKERYYWLVSTTFFLLVLSFSSRLWFERIEIAGVPAYWMPRVAAWACTAFAIYLAVQRRKTRSQPIDGESSDQ